MNKQFGKATENAVSIAWITDWILLALATVSVVCVVLLALFS